VIVAGPSLPALADIMECLFPLSRGERQTECARRRSPAGQAARGGRRVTRSLLEQISARQNRLAGLPVLANADFGHISPLATLPLGGRAALIIGDATRWRVSDR
jgi:hypothetical protein